MILTLMGRQTAVRALAEGGGGRWQIAERGEFPTFQAQAEESSHDRVTRAVSGALSAATRARSGPQSLAADSSGGCSADRPKATRERDGGQARLVRLATVAGGTIKSGWRATTPQRCWGFCTKRPVRSLPPSHGPNPPAVLGFQQAVVHLHDELLQVPRAIMSGRACPSGMAVFRVSGPVGWLHCVACLSGCTWSGSAVSARPRWR